jgi:hypothetical protein
VLALHSLARFEEGSVNIYRVGNHLLVICLLLIKVLLIQTKYFVDTPHPDEVNSHHAEVNKDSRADVEVALEGELVNVERVLRQRDRVADAVHHHEEVAAHDQTRRPCSKSGLGAVPVHVVDCCGEQHDVEYVKGHRQPGLVLKYVVAVWQVLD